MSVDKKISELTDVPEINGSENVVIEKGLINYKSSFLALKNWILSFVDVSWGNISGTLSNQTDLQNALDLKIEDAPTDGNEYARKDGGWTQVEGGVTSVNSEVGDVVLDGDDINVSGGQTINQKFTEVEGDISQNATEIITKANQTDLDTTNSNVSQNTSEIATKASQTDLDATNSNVTQNANAILTKADQTALDTTNLNVSQNTSNIATKADQTALDATNSNVTTNANDIDTLENDLAQLDTDVIKKADVSSETVKGGVYQSFNATTNSLVISFDTPIS